MFQRYYRAGAALLFVSISTGVQAAERRPWPRRPGVVLVQPKAGGDLQTVTRAHSASTLHVSAASLRTEEDLAEALLKTGAYAFAEPDYLMPAAQSPNDPEFSQQWFHSRIRSAEAWDTTIGSNLVTVALLDTGVDVTHPDLAPNLELPGWNVVSLNTDITPVATHGTQVAGVIGAAGNNAVGVSGMNWSIRILPVRITNNADTTAWCSDMAGGITWAADHGAQIINLSYSTLGCPMTIEVASRYARTKGAMVFVASGNEGWDITPYYPPVRSYVLVGATDSTDKRASFSNYGSVINWVAPGTRILTTEPGGGYGLHDGSSFAAPIAAGIAALIRAYHPAFTPEEIARVLDATARSGPGVDGQGRLDAAAALASAKKWADSGVWTPPLKLTVEGAESVVNVQAGSGSASAAIRVYPNPWRSDRHPIKEVTFAPASTRTQTIKIFTVSGHLVKTLSVSSGPQAWDLTTESGDAVASGLYIYLASGDAGLQSRGKLAIIR